jgi:hypothetical protein
MRSFFMPIAAETYRPQAFDIRNTRPFIAELPQLSERRVDVSALPHEEGPPESGTGNFISYFDTNWQRENLPQDWYKLRSLKGKHVGFSMQTQMDLLKDAQNTEEVTSWTQKTKQDLVGFKLEYLSDHVVYPCKYERSASDPTRLENSLYGNADMVETVSADERNGSVVRGLKEMKAFFLDENTPDGSIAIMTSPAGPSGLKTDDGKDIAYPDSYFFIMQKQGETVHNFTLKTDFTIAECREALYQLTGRRLSPTAPMEEYVEAIAKITPREDGAPMQVEDIVTTLESVRPEYAFKTDEKKTSWHEVYVDIAQGEKLYEFNHKTQDIIEEFEQYALEGTHSKEDLQKAVAVTILRMSKYFFEEEQDPQPQIGTLSQGQWADIKPRLSTGSFGAALEQAAERPGCAGGGKGSSSVSVESITPRLGSAGEDEFGDLQFNCPHCHKTITRSPGNLYENCPECSESVRC